MMQVLDEIVAWTASGKRVALGDQPWISAEAVARVAGAARPDFVAARATYDGLGSPLDIDTRSEREVVRK